jgi:hypothetical protein
MTRRISLISLLESALAVTAVLVCVSTMAAQKSKKEEDANTRTVQGTVLDGENPVQQAVVQLKDTRTLQVLSFITGEDGNYHFANLKKDVEYEVKASHGGSNSDWRRVSIFDSRKLVVLNLKLEKK